MITAAHALVFSEDAEATRSFLRDVLELSSVDAGGGWLVFKLPPAEVGVHPEEGLAGAHHELFFMCDDIEATVAELEAKGVELASGIEDEGFGRIVRFRLPGAGEMGIYQPRHPTAFDLPG